MSSLVFLNASATHQDLEGSLWFTHIIFQVFLVLLYLVDFSVVELFIACWIACFVFVFIVLLIALFFALFLWSLCHFLSSKFLWLTF